MKISGGQQLTHPVFYPLITLHAAAARTVPVAAAMVLIMQMETACIVAPVMMHTYARRVATAQTA